MSTSKRSFQQAKRSMFVDGMSLRIYSWQKKVPWIRWISTK
jgi:hypothetical protein